MKMKDTFFSFPRFANYFKKVLVEDRKRLLQRIISLFGILLLISFFISQINYHNALETIDRIGIEYTMDPAFDGLLVLFIILLFAGSILSASYIMESMSSKTGRIYALMLPATSFEKYIVRWLIYTIGFLVAYFLLFFLVDVVRVSTFSIIYPEIESIALIHPIETLYKDICENYLIYFLWSSSLYFFSQSFFVLGSSLWPKHAFLKTFTAYTLLGMLFIGLTGGLFNMLVHAGDVFYASCFPLNDDDVLLIASVFLFSFAIFFWWLAYKRFKEMEVVNRW